MNNLFRTLALVFAIAVLATACGPAVDSAVELRPAAQSEEPTSEATTSTTEATPPTSEAVPSTSEAPLTRSQVALADLADAEARWAALGVDSYTYNYIPRCECEENGSNQAVTVVDGVVTEVTNDAGPSFFSGRTAEELFDSVRRTLESDARVEVEYNPETGFIVEAVLDVEAASVDGGEVFNTSEFTVSG